MWFNNQGNVILYGCASVQFMVEVKTGKPGVLADVFSQKLGYNDLTLHKQCSSWMIYYVLLMNLYKLMMWSWMLKVSRSCRISTIFFVNIERMLLIFKSILRSHLTLFYRDPSLLWLSVKYCKLPCTFSKRLTWNCDSVSIESSGKIPIQRLRRGYHSVIGIGASCKYSRSVCDFERICPKFVLCARFDCRGHRKCSRVPRLDSSNRNLSAGWGWKNRNPDSRDVVGD